MAAKAQTFLQSYNLSTTAMPLPTLAQNRFPSLAGFSSQSAVSGGSSTRASASVLLQPASKKGPMDRHIDTVTESDRWELDELFSLFIIGERLPFKTAESPFLLYFLQKLRPSYSRDRNGLCRIPDK